MVKWEYKRIDRSLTEEELNEFGDSGWEMISFNIIELEEWCP